MGAGAASSRPFSSSMSLLYIVNSMMVNNDTAAAPTELEHARVEGRFENIKDDEEDYMVPCREEYKYETG